MSERFFRLILGVTLWLSLVLSAFYETMTPIYLYVGFLLFEGITNWRITLIINRIRYGLKSNPTENSHKNWINKIDSERALRIMLALLVIISFTVLPDFMWFLPWFFAGMLILAGTTNICPMVMFLKWSGMK